MDEVLLIHDWQAVPHVAMNLLSAVTGRAPQLLWTICAVHGVSCCRSSACVLSAHEVPSWVRCQLARDPWTTANRDRVVVACADCENHEVWNSRGAASVVCP